MENSIAYVILVVFFALCAFQYEFTGSHKKQTVITILCVTVFFLFFGFRGFVYTDWVSYYPSFLDAEWSDFADWSLLEDQDDEKVAEPGFMFLMRLCKSIIDDYTFFIAILTAINTALFVRFLKRWNIRNVAFAIMIFITFWGLNIMFDLLRNSIAIFIFANSLEYIQSRKPIHYFGLCLIAVLFHLSSVIFFPLYFILNIKLNRWIFLGAFIGLFVFFVTHQSIIELFLKFAGLEGSYGMMLKAYTEMYDSSRPFSIFATLEHFILVGLVFIYYDEITEKYRGHSIFINVLVMYFIMFYLLSDFFVMSIRMSTLFVISYWVLWYDIIKNLHFMNNKMLLSSYLVLYSLFTVITNNMTPVYKYDNVFFGIESYENRLNIFNTYFKDIDK